MAPHLNDRRVKIICEVGSNFNGDLEEAKRYVRTAARVGADAVKFQTLKKNLIISPRTLVNGKVVEYPIYESFSSIELPDEWHYTLKHEADVAGIEFISTPFHIEAVNLLCEVGLKTLKIASGDITFFPLLRRAAESGRDIILSTGASTLAEVKYAVEYLSKYGARCISLMHCVSNYPTKWSEVNLLAIQTMIQEFKMPIGFSDHTIGGHMSIGAVAIGARLIEKHVTFDRDSNGPDHHFSMTFDEFGELIMQIRQLEAGLGSGTKEPSPDELPRIKRIRRGRYAIKTGEPTVDTNDVLWLRPEHDVFI